jgi:REP element-mobilizing transposase RayT
VTFCTYRRWILPERTRLAVLNCCLREDGASVELRVAVVMPDHVHMIFTPLVDDEKLEVYSLGEIMNAIKGASAHKINRELGRTGHVWQTESFDHVLRSSESLDQKIQYVLQNPVRAGLGVGYPWLWHRQQPNPYALQ